MVIFIAMIIHIVKLVNYITYHVVKNTTCGSWLQRTGHSRLHDRLSRGTLLGFLTGLLIFGEQIAEPGLRISPSFLEAEGVGLFLGLGPLGFLLGPLRLSGPGKPKGEQIITQVAEDYSCLVFCASQKFYVRIREQ